MIEFEHVTKAYRFQGVPKYIARDMSIVIPDGARVALMGRNGSGKSTILAMIAGNVNPDKGRIRVTGSISWPIGLTGCIQGELSGAQNVRFIARVYGVDTDELLAFVADFTELGANFYEPVKSYSSGMRGRLNFGMSMGIHFDTYLIDGLHATGDASFKSKSKRLFEDRMSRSGLIIVSQSDSLMRQLCTAGAVLDAGHVTFYPDIEEALEIHHQILRKDGEEAPVDELLD